MVTWEVRESHENSVYSAVSQIELSETTITAAMRILHINVRLNEGGAAKVTLDLHTRLLDRGVESSFFYGYGPGAKRNLEDQHVPNAYPLGLRTQVVGNYAVHKLFGVDLFSPVGQRASSLRAAVREADIIHLHVIHSYFVPYAWLFGLLREANKKVVWTLHDSWSLTGRCAITGSCDKWLSGCGSCPLMMNYPSARVDLSGFESGRKRKEIATLKDNLVMVGCSRWVTRRARTIFPQQQVYFVPNGLDKEMEECIRSRKVTGGLSGRKPSLLVISADLSDTQKQNLDIIRRVLESGLCTVHTVGKRSVFDGENVVNHGQVSDRSRLAEIYRNADATLFTSVVDNFSLVMVESLAAGTPVLALDSPGSREVLGMVRARPIKDEGEMLSIVKQRSFFDPYQQGTRDTLQERALEVFSGERMTRQYMDVYESLLAHASL